MVSKGQIAAAIVPSFRLGYASFYSILGCIQYATNLGRHESRSEPSDRQAD